jgi:hypothetical protein
MFPRIRVTIEFRPPPWIFWVLLLVIYAWAHAHHVHIPANLLR